MKDSSKEKQQMNWMKNASLGDVTFIEPTSVSHVQEIVKDTINFPSPVRPAGRILSPSHICSNSGGTTVSFLKMNKIYGIKYVQVPNGHEQAGETIPCVDCQCGTTLRDLQMYAHENNLEMPFSAENGMATVGGSCFATVKDSSIGLSPVKGLGLGDVASMLWSVDVVESNGELKTYTVLDEHGQFDKKFQGLLDSYGTQGIAVRMLLVLRPKLRITTTVSVFPLDKSDKTNANELFKMWKEASDQEGNILSIIAIKEQYILVEERLPTNRVRNSFAPFSILLSPFYHWLKKVVSERGYPPSWLSMLYPFSGSFLLRFNSSCRRPGNYYNADIPIEKDKVTFTLASFPIDKFTEVVTCMLSFIRRYDQEHNFTPKGIVLYFINISGQRVAGPFSGGYGEVLAGADEEKYKFCFDPIYNDPNDDKWEKFLIAFNALAKEKGGRPSLNQSLVLEYDKAYGSQAISYSNRTSSRFVSCWLQQFLHAHIDV